MKKSTVGSFWNRINKGLKYLRKGQFSLVISHIRSRLYSSSLSFGLRRNLYQDYTPPSAKINFYIRPMKKEDVDLILNHEEVKRTFPHIIAKRKKLVRAKIPSCYVAVTSDDTPCYMQWLIGPEQNERIQSFFGMTFPELERDEALLEGAFSNPDFRGMGVMPEAMSKITAKAHELGVNRVITFVDIDNVPSLKGCQRAGFSLYILKKSEWRFFRRRVIYDVIPRDLLSEYYEKTGGRPQKYSVTVTT